MITNAPTKTRHVKAPHKRALTPEEKTEMMRLRKDGWAIQRIADKYQLSFALAQKIVSRVAP